MAAAARRHVVLVHVEVVGDTDAFAGTWQRWVDRHVHGAPGLVDAVLHREANGRRLLLLERWQNGDAYDAWLASGAQALSQALFDEHAVRSATSRWEETA